MRSSADSMLPAVYYSTILDTLLTFGETLKL